MIDGIDDERQAKNVGKENEFLLTNMPLVHNPDYFES